MSDDCPHIGQCEMFKLLKLSGSLQVWKTRYCCADYSQCARHQRASEGRPIPANLMPNGAHLRFAKSG